MKNGQRKHPLLLGVLYGTAIYGSIALAILCITGVIVAAALIIPFILFIFVLISQMRNIAFAKKEEDVDYCLNTYFIYKYITMPVGLIAAGIVGTLIVTIIWMIIKWLEEPLIIILIFFLVVFIIAIIPCSLIVFTLIELPCFISMDCVLGITQKKYGITSVERRAHFLLQMIPVLDIIDGLYISIKYWNRGRGLAVVTFAFTLSITALVLSIYLAIRFI